MYKTSNCIVIEFWNPYYTGPGFLGKYGTSWYLFWQVFLFQEKFQPLNSPGKTMRDSWPTEINRNSDVDFSGL